MKMDLRMNLLQNILKQRDDEIVYVPDDNTITRLNYINKINSMKRISDKLIIVEKEKRTKNLNMPIYIGKAILDLTKYLMYDFFYNIVIKSLQACSLYFPFIFYNIKTSNAAYLRRSKL